MSSRQDSSPRPSGSRYNLRTRNTPDEEKHALFKKQIMAEDQDDSTEDTDQDDPTYQVTESSGGDTESDSDSYERECTESQKILGGQIKKLTEKTNTPKASSMPDKKYAPKASPKPEKNISRESSQSVKHTSASRGTSQHDTNSFSLQLGCIVFAVALAIAYSQQLFPFNLNHGMKNTAAGRSNRPVHHRFGNLTHELEAIQEKYAKLNLGEHFWDVIAGSSWSHMVNERSIKQPVVIMLVSQPGSQYLNEVGYDIGKMFAKTFTQGSEDLVHIDGANHGFQDVGKAKLDIDRKLKEEFDRGGKVALVSQFDKLPGCTVMLFHSYCDNDNAPYKDAVILFTFQLTKRVPLDATQREIEEAAQEHLNQAWSQCPEELTKDKVTAMHSRVSNNIGFVSEI